MNNQSYTIPKLNTCKGDLSKSWYVYFVFSDGKTKKQFRFKTGINYFHTKKERELEGKNMSDTLLIQLKSGWNPFTNQVKEEKVNFTIVQAFDDMLAIKKAYITKRSYRTYFEETRLFKTWLTLRKFDKIFIHNFTNLQARMYFDWLLKDKGYCGKTHNNHYACLRTFFNAFLERDIIQVSPLKGIKQVKQESGLNTTYSSEEQDRIEKYLLENNKEFFYVTRFIKFCFLRRSELSGLKVKHIKWANKTIIVPSDSSKSRKNDSVTIPGSLEKYIYEMGILELDPELYIFGKFFKPSLIRLNREDDFTKYQQEINKLLEVNSNSSFYSWKHTGVVELYGLTKDPYTVMRQCRHTDVGTTMIYLRALGCGVNEDVREW